MTDSTRSYQQFFAELKRRRVFKVATIYGVVAFGVLQVAEPLATALGLSDSFLSLVVGLLLLGFPVALAMAWAFEVTPEGVQKAEPAAPGEIAAIVAQPALKRWPAGLLALAGAALLFGGWWLGRQEPGPEAIEAGPGSRLVLADLSDDTRPSLAVLPFVNMSADEEQEYFSDGITEEILNTLARVRELKVAARTSAFAYKGRSIDLREVGDSLGVQYLIEGSVRKAGDELRITAQLIDASDGTHLWSDTYDRTMSDVFAIQTEIAEEIAKELRVPLGLDDVHDLVVPTADLHAYDLYLAGRGRMRERYGSLPEAIRLFEAALARDSTWAPAWAGLADAFEVIGWYPDLIGWDWYPEMLGEAPPTTAAERGAAFDMLHERAAAAARRALALDPENAEAHVVLGSVHRNRYEWPAARAEYETAIEIDSENAEAYLQYSQLLLALGETTDGLRLAERSAALDRLPIAVRNLAYAHLVAGQYEQALDVLDQSDPNRSERVDWPAWIDETANLALGRYGELSALQGRGWDERIIRALQAGDIDALPNSAQAIILMNFGRADEAAERLLSNYLRYRDRHVDPGAFLTVPWMPLFDPIREHPAYLQALREANLEGVTPDRPSAGDEAAP
jgi:adenylate cyclase